MAYCSAVRLKIIDREREREACKAGETSNEYYVVETHPKDRSTSNSSTQHSRGTYLHTSLPEGLTTTAPSPIRKILRRRKSSFLVVQFDRISSRAPSLATVNSYPHPSVLETKNARKVEPNFPRICNYSFPRNTKFSNWRQVVGTLTIGQWLLRERERHPTVPRLRVRCEWNRRESNGKKKKKRGEKAFERARPIFL